MLSGKLRAVIVTGVVFLVITLVSVALRCFVRIKIVQKMGYDDTLLITAATINIGFFATGAVAVNYGLGADYEPKDRSKALLVILDTKHRSVLYSVASLSSLTGLSVILFTIFRCHPIDAYWKSKDFGDDCVSKEATLGVWYLFSATAALSDLTLSMLPIITISQLQMRISTKLALGVILAFGCSATAAVIARIPLLDAYTTNNILYQSAVIEILTYVESSMVITAGGVLLLRPALRILSRGRDVRNDYANTVSWPGSARQGDAARC